MDDAVLKGLISNKWIMVTSHHINMTDACFSAVFFMNFDYINTIHTKDWREYLVLWCYIDVGLWMPYTIFSGM